MSRELWQVEAERVGGAALADALTEMRDGQRDVVARLDTIIKGFPDGDIEGHRRYHEAIIERMELRNKMVREALIKAAGSGFIVGGAWVAYALWEAFKISVQK